MGIIDFIYPNNCKICGCKLDNKSIVLCKDCLKNGDYYLYEPFEIKGANQADSPLVYKDFVRSAMHNYKFNGKRIYADWFASITTECVQSKIDIWKPDIITYVPISFGRWLKRGYNQSELVAKFVANNVNVPCKATMSKRMFIKRQSSINDNEKRAENAQNAFYVKNNIDVYSKRILLIDDVITTGSTVSACANILSSAGAKAVFVVGMTKTPLKRQKNQNLV